jgi:hypothetical protein
MRSGPPPDPAGIQEPALAEPAQTTNQPSTLMAACSRTGGLETFPLPLNQDGSARLRDSAQVIRQALDELGEK